MLPISSLDSLRARKFKITPCRRHMIELFEREKRPLSAHAMNMLLKKNYGILVNKTTIYRELDFLVREGIVKTLRLNERHIYYETSNLPHHHHLICTSCNDIKEITIEDSLHTLEQRLAKTNRFTISAHALEFFGLCHKCKTI